MIEEQQYQELVMKTKLEFGMITEAAYNEYKEDLKKK